MILSAYLINGQPVGTVVTYYTDAELNGNPPFKVEETLSQGYADISSITNWDRFRGATGKDIKFIKRQIQLLCQGIGYNNLPLNEQILANKYFASGVEYFNSEVSAAEQDAFFLNFYKLLSDEARRDRDLAVTGLMVKWLYTGQLSLDSTNQLISASKNLRTDYLRDGVEGIGYGDAVSGIINFCENSNAYAPFSIVDVDKNAKVFSVAGNKTTSFVAGNKFRIKGSTGNDGYYTIVSSAYNNTNTTITVTEAVASSVADGSAYVNGFLSYEGTTDLMQADILDIYINGNYALESGN